MGIHFPITADNAAFLRTLESTKRGVEDTAKEIKGSGIEIEGIFTKMKNAALGLGAAFSAQQIAREVVNIRGQFQQLEVAFTTMLGSAEKAQALMSQLTRTAAITPFGLQDVANGAKSLLAYGIAAEDVNGTLIKLGDIAAGLSIPLNDLVYLYGTTMVQGRMYTQDLRQFMGRGIPIVEALADTMGIAQNKVQDFVTAGKVGSKELVAAIDNMTAAGSKFGGLMEAQSKTITGQISNIEDAMDMMFNEMGKKSEGVINAALDGVSTLIANYEKVGEAIMVAVTAYGVYKGALMASIAIEKINNAILTERTRLEALNLIAINKKSEAEIVAAAKSTVLANAQNALALSLRNVAKATILNPYVLLGVAVTSLLYGVYKLATYETEAEKAQKELNKTISQAEVEISKEYAKLEQLNGALKGSKEGSEEYNKAKKELIKSFGKYDSNLEKEITSVGLSAAAYERLTEAINKSIGARAAASAMNKIDADYEKTLDENLEKLRNRLIEKLGDKEGAKIYGKLLAGIYSETLSYSKKGFKDFEERKNINEIDGISPEVIKALNEVSGVNDEDKITNHKAETYIKNIIDAQRLRKKLREELNEKWGVEEEASNSTDNAPTQTAKKLKEQAIKDYNDALKAKEDYLKSEEKLTEQEHEKKIKELNDNIKLAKEKAELYGADFSKDAQNKEKKQSDERLKLQLANQQAEIDLLKEGSEKKIRQINLNYEKEKAEIEKLEKEYGKSEESSKRLSLAEQTRDTAIKEVYKEEFAQWQEYIQNYGTFYQQRLAITQEYEEKIKNAQSEVEKQTLIAERDTKLAGVRTNEFKSNIDWNVVFGEFGNMFRDVITPTLENAKKYTETKEFKNASPESQQTLIEAIKQMEDAIGNVDNVSFKSLGDDINKYRNALKAQEQAEKSYAIAMEEVKVATEEYIKALSTGTAEEQANAKNNLKSAKDKEKQESENLANLTEATEQAATEMTDSATRLKSNMDGVVSGLQSITSGSLKGVYDGLIELGNANIPGKIGDAMGKVADTLEDVPIVGWVLSILDIFKEGASEVVGGLIDGVFGAMNGIIEDVLSGDLLVTVLQSLGKGVKGFWDALTFGLTEDWFSTNADEVVATIDVLTKQNEKLADEMERLTNVMKDNRGYNDVQKNYKELLKLQSQTEENLKAIIGQQMRYSGSHHSFNKEFQLSWYEVRYILDNIKSDFQGNLLELNQEQMRLLLQSPIGQHILNTNYGWRVAEAMQSYIDTEGAYEDLLKDFHEALTGISFDSMYDSFVDSLMDMEYSAEEAADNISEYFMKAMISNKIGDLYAERLEKWYTDFAESISNDGELNEGELDALRNSYNEIVNDAIKTRNEIAQAVGYTGEGAFSQEGSAKGFQTMNQETANELNGRFTALQIAGEGVRNELAQGIAMIRDFMTNITNGNVIIDIRNLIAISNSHLEDIAKYAKITASYSDKLDSIINNTNRL